MNSFIYNDLDLLEKLFVIGQEKIDPRQLNESAIKIINNLKSQVSPLKAEKNPTISDMESLNDFKNWAKNNNAAVSGNLLVENDQFNTERLESFLTDLRDRFVSNPSFSESIANVIEEANQTFNKKMSAFPPQATQEQLAANQRRSNTPLLNTKINDPENDKGEQSEPEGQTAPQGAGSTAGLAVAVHRGDLSLLNGRTLDIDDIKEGARAVCTLASSGDRTHRVFTQLDAIASRIFNVAGRFHGLTDAKTQGRTSMGCAPSDDGLVLKAKITNVFNDNMVPDAVPNAPGKRPAAYSYSELAQIALYFVALMSEVGDLYSHILTIPMFTNSPEMEKQLTMAKEYEQNFTNAAAQLTSLHQSTAGNGPPR